MAQFFLNFSEEVGLSDGHKLLQTINQVQKEDEVVIVMDSNDAHQADQIFRILDRHNFQYLPKGTGSGEKYQILARRK